MDNILLDEAQFKYVLEDWDIQDKTSSLLKAVYIDGCDIDASACKYNVNTRHAYRVCKQFKERMLNKLTHDGKRLRVVFADH